MGALPAGEWNALLDRQPAPTPFMRHEYLAALEASGSAVPGTGWKPHGLLLREGPALRAACALYVKSHSYGEYVFDWAWADAWRRHGLRYYPKALVAVPFTPVPGTRLLAVDDRWRRRLVDALQSLTQGTGLSSAHVLFIDDADAAAFQAAGWTLRHGVQFHWQRSATPGAGTFDDLLQSLQREKRKKIQQERRRVREAGVSFEVLEGAAIDVAHWDLFHRCYTLTYEAHRSTPYLTRDFFSRMQACMAEHWVMFVAWQAGEPIAVSLVAVDRARRTAWGRYWGALKQVPCLHFEACYYQPLAWCLDHGIDRFEGGAQGEHKMARGLLPVQTQSAHWVADPRFAAAVADAMAEERGHIASYVDELSDRNPFKNGESRPQAASDQGQDAG